jgi:hypothetical protein
VIGLTKLKLKDKSYMKFKIAVLSIISLPFLASELKRPTQKIQMPKFATVLEILNSNNDDKSFSDQKKNELIARRLAGQNLYPEAVIMLLYSNTETESIQNLAEKANRLIDAARADEKRPGLKQPDRKE